MAKKSLIRKWCSGCNKWFRGRFSICLRCIKERRRRNLLCAECHNPDCLSPVVINQKDWSDYE